MNSQDVLQALIAARTFKPESVAPKQNITPVTSPTSFVSMYDQLDQLDQNPFNAPIQSK